MAYVIGSQKGKDKAQSMKAGETYNASDGSVWTKEADGSVTVTTSGNTYKNAYTPTSGGGGSSGGGGGSSSGGSKGGYSQYTAPTLGDTWDNNTDYQAIINSAVANGDYVTAAKAEQLRNQKITATGSKYNTTNMYTGHLNNVDYGTLGQQQMANNASWQDVQDTLDSRVSKALNTSGLEKYAYDDTFWMMYNYIQDQKNAEIMQNYEDKIAELEQGRPEDYQGKYDPQIDALLNEILNRDDFSYDAANDPLYQQYANMYRREGDRAMKETMAEAAAGAGGMNTYAITAAQQANSYYNSQLNDKIPELYQLAYQMYLNDKESKVQDLGILQNMDATQYSRYRDTINDFYNDKNFAYGAYQDAVQQGNWQTNFDYNGTLDNRNFNNGEYWKNKEWDYNDYWTNKEYTDNRGDIEYDRKQNEKNEAYDKIVYYIENGVTSIDPALMEKAEMTQDEVNLLVTAIQSQLKSKGSSSGGGGGGSKQKSGGDDEGEKKTAVLDSLTGNDKGYQGSADYTEIAAACEQMTSQGDEWGAAALAQEAKDKGFITQEEYNILLRKNNPLLDAVLSSNIGKTVTKK